MQKQDTSASISAVIAIVGVIVSFFLLKRILSFLLTHWIVVSVLVLLILIAGIVLFARSSSNSAS